MLTDARIDEALAAWKPPGVTYRWKQRLRWTGRTVSGLPPPFRPAHAFCHRDGTREVYAADPRAFTRDVHRRLALFIVAHETAHWSNGHCTHRSKLLSHVEEYEAEMRGQQMMRTCGIAVPRMGIAHAKLYIRQCIACDLRRGRPIQAHIRQWALAA